MFGSGDVSQPSIPRLMLHWSGGLEDEGGMVERLRKVSKTKCWKVLGAFRSTEDPALLLNYLDLLCSEGHCRSCPTLFTPCPSPQQGDHNNQWESPVEFHPV